MTYELLSAGFPAVIPNVPGGVSPQLAGKVEQQSPIPLALVVCGLNCGGRLFFELASVHDISPSGCHIHLCTEPQRDSPLAIRMFTNRGEVTQESAQLLFEVTRLQPEAEGWDVEANSLGGTDLRTLVFPSQKT